MPFKIHVSLTEIEAWSHLKPSRWAAEVSNLDRGAAINLTSSLSSLPHSPSAPYVRSRCVVRFTVSVGKNKRCCFKWTHPPYLYNFVYLTFVYRQLLTATPFRFPGMAQLMEIQPRFQTSSGWSAMPASSSEDPPSGSVKPTARGVGTTQNVKVR